MPLRTRLALGLLAAALVAWTGWNVLLTLVAWDDGVHGDASLHGGATLLGALGLWRVHRVFEQAREAWIARSRSEVARGELFVANVSTVHLVVLGALMVVALGLGMIALVGADDPVAGTAVFAACVIFAGALLSALLPYVRHHPALSLDLQGLRYLDFGLVEWDRVLRVDLRVRHTGKGGPRRALVLTVRGPRPKMPWWRSGWRGNKLVIGLNMLDAPWESIEHAVHALRARVVGPKGATGDALVAGLVDADARTLALVDELVEVHRALEATTDEAHRARLQAQAARLQAGIAAVGAQSRAQIGELVDRVRGDRT
jgi:hypothetical protein